ncbi:MAG: hypothetical protein ACYDD1_13730 [Caulobacteraceae bacterium]
MTHTLDLWISVWRQLVQMVGFVCDHPLAISLVGSALLRGIAVYVCAQGCVLLGPKARNYWTPPWFVRPTIGFFGAVTTANIAELLQRAVTIPPPRILLTGYGLSISEALLALSLYVWLLGTWAPEEVQAQRQWRADRWRAKFGLWWPCLRRKWEAREQMRAEAKLSSRGSRRAGRVNRALHAENPPVMEDLGDVIPDALRRD